MRMRKNYISAILIVFSAIVLSACNKDTDIFIPDPGQVTGPDSTWYASITASMPVNNLMGSLALAPDIDSMNVNDSSADTVLSASGLQCVFPIHSCVDTTGSPVSGMVYIESYLLKGKGQLISMGLPTVSNGNLLVSGGVFSIRLKKGNAAIQLAPNAHLSFQYVDTSISQQMQLFNVDTTAIGQLNWIQNTDSSNNISAGNSYYDISCNQLQWINCDHFYGDTSSSNKTTVSVKLPANLTNANTVAYIVFNDIRSLMPMNADVATKKFITNKVPVGMNVTIVTISKDGNFYYLGQQAITTALPTVGANSQSLTITPVRYSIDDIKLYLSSF
jgi:hypothetical protein